LSVFFVSTSLNNKELESKINESGLKSDTQIQVQDMYLHVNQRQAEYSGLYGIVAFLINEICKDIKKFFFRLSFRNRDKFASEYFTVTKLDDMTFRLMV